MRRLLLTLPLLFVPFVAAGQTVGGDQVSDMAWLQQQSSLKSGQPTQGSLLLQSQSSTTAAANNALLSLNPLSGGTVSSSTLLYGVTPNVTAQVGVNQRSWVTQPRIVGSEVGAIYNAGRYSLGVSVAQDQVPNTTPLPRVLPGAVTGVNGLPDFDSSTQVNARGRVALTGNSGLLLGASVGRIRLLPGNLMGLSTLDQKALSFGIDHGPISGSIIGRTMAPEPGMPNSFTTDRRWNSIDLGVTWRLPWQGSLSFGAQNLWSSGNATNTPAGPPEPDQSRTPYVQYHQDL
ncbi:hypothetical protein GCM10007862_30410 [Dyella lipolytica]|uniref:Uncharacterized protein n=1 Tax=Dyella lipolytica TaxID=1867835 RepID=A0ABW8IX73_9GAMM|nr:hypothetical protein [Dyella lipolytica]GLQ47990.1 hypothetical protein GCM10007862_30410 [Dyella lipolytica]